MELQFLGTGADEGIPGVFCGCSVCRTARTSKGKDIRRRASAVIDGRLLIDITPDIFTQTCENGILVAARSILVTHAHRGHLYMDELLNSRSPYKMTARSGMTIYGSRRVTQAIEKYYESADLTGSPELPRPEELLAFNPREIDGYTVTPLPARHCDGAFIYLIEDGKNAILYALDTGYFPEETWDYLTGHVLDLVVMDCCDLTGNITQNHMNIEDNVTVMRRLYSQGITDRVSCYASSHFSHMSKLTHREIDERLRPYGIIAAYDNLTIECYNGGGLK